MEVGSAILCDTDIIIEFLNRNEEVAQKINEFGSNNICISSITLNEILLGAVSKTDLNHLVKWISRFQIIDLTLDISIKCTALIISYSLSHKPSIPDMLIASTALSKGLELFTLNIKDFHFIRGLRLIDHNIKPKRISWLK